MHGRDRVTLEDIDCAMAQLADLIESHKDGEKFICIFDRLEREREELAAKGPRLKSRLDAARQRYAASQAQKNTK